MDRSTRWLGATFLVAPALLFASGLYSGVLVDDMMWQGVMGLYAGLFFVPANLTLAYLVWRRRRRLGVANFIVAATGGTLLAGAFNSYFATGLAGATVGFEGRSTLEAMANSALTNPHPAQYFTFIALLVPLSWLLLGVSAFITRAAARPSAVLIALGGVAFATAQAALGDTGEVVSPALLFLGMAPLGWSILRDGLEPEAVG